jgi:tetratricopeptide (TPR) repeat protein/transcriptional regulator with XRE-family HTH domain
MPRPVDFASLLRQHRVAAGLTQEDLAERAGLSTRGVSDLERGLRRAPHRATVVLLADALRLSPDDRAALEAAGRRARASLGTARAGPASHLPSGGFLGALPVGTLVARERELDRGRTSVEAVAGGAGRLVLLTGEPGIGKTRLAQEIAVEMLDRGFLVAAGRCYESEQTVPYYPFLEALAALHSGAPPSVRADVPRRWPDLALLMPERVGPLPEPLQTHEHQQRLFRAVTGFIVAVAAKTPVAVMLDDLHWADGSSLKLLHHLARHTRTSRVLLLATYRDVEVNRQHPLAATLRDMEREQVMDRIAVRRLDEQDTAALIAATIGETEVSGDVAELVFERTEGNPFFVQQVVRVLVERGDLYHEKGRWARRAITEIEVPESVRSVIGQRLSSLPEATQDVLREASVLGQEFRFDDLLLMSGRSEDELEGALKDAAAAGLARETGRGGGTYGFDHALTQQALHAELPPRRRRRLHLAAGGAIERMQPGKVPELAWHFLQGGDSERALGYALLAGDRAEEIHAHPEAEWQFRTAVQLAREIGDRAGEARALERLGDVLRIAGRFDESLEAIEQAARVIAGLKAAGREAGSLEAEGRVTAKIGQALGGMGRQSEAIDRLRPMAVRLEADAIAPSRALAELDVTLAQLLIDVWQHREAQAPAERAAEIARALGHDALLAHAEYARSTGLDEIDPVAARAARQEAIRLAETTHQLWTLGNLRNEVATDLANRGRFEEASAMWERALANARRLGDPVHLAFLLTRRGWHEFSRGDWERARASFDEGVDTIRDYKAVAVTVWCTSGPAVLRFLTQKTAHEGEDATRDLEELLRLSPSAPAWATLWATYTLAESDQLQGKPSAAVARLEDFLLEQRERGVGGPFFLVCLAKAYLAVDNLERAGEAIAAALELTDPHAGENVARDSAPRGYPASTRSEERSEGRHHASSTAGMVVGKGGDGAPAPSRERSPALQISIPEVRDTQRKHRPEVLEAQGRLLGRQGRFEDAYRALDEALALAREIGMPYCEAHVLYAYGEILTAEGNADIGRQKLVEAREIFRRLGAWLYANRLGLGTYGAGRIISTP